MTENILIEAIENGNVQSALRKIDFSSLNNKLQQASTKDEYVEFVREWKVIEKVTSSAGRYANTRRNQTAGSEAWGYNFDKLSIRPYARFMYELRAEGKAKYHADISAKLLEEV